TFHCPFTGLGDDRTAILDSAVRAVAEFEIDLEFEILGRAGAPDEKRVHGDRVCVGRLANDFAVLRSPNLWITIPASKRLAVENGRESSGVVGCGRARAKVRTWQHAVQSGHEFFLIQ